MNSKKTKIKFKFNLFFLLLFFSVFINVQKSLAVVNSAVFESGIKSFNGIDSPRYGKIDWSSGNSINGYMVGTSIATGITNPTSVEVDSSGLVYAFDAKTLKTYQNGTWTTFSPQPTISSTAIYDFKIDLQGNIYVVDTSANNIKKFSKSSNSWSNFDKTPTGFTTPTSVATDSLNNVYVLDSSANIYKYDIQANNWSTFIAYGSLVDKFYGTYRQGVMAFDASDNFYWADNNGVHRRTYAGAFSYLGILTTTFGSEMTVDKAGNIYINEAGNTLKRWNGSSWIQVAPMGSTTLGSVYDPYSITVDGNDNVYVVMLSGTYRVQKFTPGTSLNIKVRTGTTADGSGSSWESWTTCPNVTNGSNFSGNPCVTDGEKYVQYQATLNTDAGTNVPVLNGVTIGTQAIFAPGWLISSPFNSTNIYNTVQKISWTSSDNGGSVKFQIRTAPDNGSGQPDWTSSKWCGKTSCSTISNNATSFADSYYTSSNGADIINTTNNLASDKKSQYFQYAAFLNPSADGLSAPTLQQVQTNYAFNTPPAISNVTYAQNADGSVSVPYTLSETYDSSGNLSHGTVSSPIKSLLFYQPDSGITLASATPNDQATNTVTKIWGVGSTDGNSAPGTYTFTVPSGVTSIRNIEIAGAGGGGSTDCGNAVYGESSSIKLGAVLSNAPGGGGGGYDGSIDGCAAGGSNGDSVQNNISATLVSDGGATGGTGDFKGGNGALLTNGTKNVTSGSVITIVVGKGGLGSGSGGSGSDGWVKMTYDATSGIPSTGIITINNPKNIPFPSQGKMLIGSELISFDSSGVAGNQRNITSRGEKFDGASGSFYTNAVNHSVNDPVFFMANRKTDGTSLIHTTNTLPATGTPITQFSINNTFDWDPKGETYLNLNGKKLTGLTFKVVANDADSLGLNNIGEASVPGLQSLDLESGIINSIITDATHTSLSPILYYNKDAAQIPLYINFSENINFDSTGGKTIVITLNSGTCTISSSILDSNQATCQYSIGNSDKTPAGDKLKVSSISTNGIIKDGFGNVLNEFNPVTNLDSSTKIIIDNTAPTADDLSDVTTNNLFTKTLNNVSDDNSGIASYGWTKVSGSGNITFGSANSTNTTISADQDGTYVIKATVTDKAGNYVDKTFTLIWDKTNPSNAGKPNVPTLTNDNTPDVFWTSAADSLSGLAKYEVQRKKEGDAGFATVHEELDVAKASYTYTDTTLVDGVYYYQILATDKAGNTSISSSSNMMKVDATKPVLESFTSTTADVTAQNAYGSGTEINIQAIYNEQLNSGSTIKVQLDNSADPAVDVILDSVDNSTGKGILSGSFTVQGPRKGYDTPDLNIRSVISESASDLAGNFQTGSSTSSLIGGNLADNKNIFIDTGEPILMSFAAKKMPSTISGSFKQGEMLRITATYSKPILSGSITLHLDTENGSEDNSDITLANISGATIYGDYIVQAGDNTDSLKVSRITAQNATDFKGNPLSITGTMTEYDLYFAANGNIPAVTNIQNIQIDTTAPVPGNPAISYQMSKTNNQTPVANIQATDNFDLSDGIMQFSLNNSTWCQAVQYASTYSFDITNSACGGSSNNETKTVYVKFIDQAGNVSSVANATIEYDNSKPILQNITTDVQNGTYGPGSQIKIIAQYNEDLKAGSSVTIQLNNGKQLTLDTIENSRQLTTTYTVGSTGSLEDSKKLKVASIQSQSVSDTSDPTNTQDSTSLSGITENLDTNKTVIIDTLAPTVNEPTGKFTLDRTTEQNKIKVTIKPYDDGLDLTNIRAQFKLLDSTSSTCSYDGAYDETISGESAFTYDDNTSAIKKACLKLTDKSGNVSQDIVIVTPNTPENFSYTDLASEAFVGAILKWSEPSYEGTGNFRKYNILRCEGLGCTPTKYGEVTTQTQNYFVFDSLNNGTTYCYSVNTEDNNGDISKYPTPVCYAPGEGPVVADTDTSFESEPYITDITKNSAIVIFKTIDAKNNSALATTAKIDVYEDENLTNLVKTVNDNLTVTHAVSVSGLNENKAYYLKISATDTSAEINPTRTETVQFNKVSDPNKYSFTTSGVLSVITNIKESLVTDTKAVITFQTNQEAKCFIDIKENFAENYVKTADNIENNFFTNHTITLVDLLPVTNYVYKITCTDESSAIVTSDEHRFTTQEKGLTKGDVDASFDKNAPEINNVSLSDVTGENATITWNTNEASNSVILYEVEGTDFIMMAGDSNVYADVSKYSTAHTVSIKNLIPDSKYLFNVMSTDSSGNIAQSSQSTFTTKEPSSLSSIKVQSKALGQATITWETGSATSSLVEYGLTTSYGQKKEDSSKTKEHTITLSDLTPGETYHFRVKGEDDQKNIFASSDITFQPKAPPKISDFKVDEITEHGAVVTFTTNVPTDSLIIYTDTKDQNNSGFQGKPEVATKHETKITNLTSGTEFSLKLKVRDEDGNETEEAFPNFKTTKDEAAPKIERVKTDSALTQNDKVQAIISWNTDELSTGEIVYREGKNGNEKKFEVNSALSFSHIGVITSFKSGVAYYFKVVSEDQAGNKVTSSDYALLTPKQRQNIIQIIIGNFTDIFGWAKF